MDLDRVENILVDFEAKLLHDQPVLEDNAQRLIAKSKEIRGRLEEPIRVGVIGEFSAGKSLLIGGLLGRADILPVSEIPTTGNITELVISQGDMPSTVVHQSTIYFIDKTEAHELFREFYNELISTIKITALDDSLLIKGKLIESAFNEQGFAPSFVEQLDTWTRDVWDSVSAGSVHSRVKELIEFTRAASAGAPILGQTRAVSSDFLKQILTIDDHQKAHSSLAYHHLHTPSKVISSAQDLQSEDLREFKTLIRKVSLDVSLPKMVWDLGQSFDQSRFAIVDFPGIGSADSKVRDRYLCKREIADMQTLVMLLNANRPGSGGANELYNIIQSDYQGDLSKAMLIGIARFNEMTYNPALLEDPQTDEDDVFSVGEYLSSPVNTSLSDDQVFSANESLRKLLDAALKFTSHDPKRVMFLMQNCAFEPYISAGLESDQLGLDHFIQTLRRCEQPTIEAWSYWSKVVDRVSPQSPIQRIKESDPRLGGGIKQFQQLIMSHVSSNGQRALNSLIQEELKKLDRERVALIDQHQQGAEREEPSQESLAVNPLILRTRQFFDRQKSRLDRMPIRLKWVDREKMLSEVFVERIPLAFARSSDFTGLMNKVHSATLCLPHTLETQQKSYLDFDDFDIVIDPLEDEYIKTYKELRLGFQNILIELLEELKEKAKVSLRIYLEDIEDLPDLVKLRDEVNSFSTNTRNWKTLLNPTNILDHLYADIIKDIPVVTEEMLQTYFPYAEDRMMSWHPKLVNDANENEHSRTQKLHFMNIISVRQNLCEMAEYVIHKSIMEFETKTHKFYSRMCEDFRSKLSNEKVMELLKKELQGSVDQPNQNQPNDGLAIANIRLVELN